MIINTNCTGTHLGKVLGKPVFLSSQSNHCAAALPHLRGSLLLNGGCGLRGTEPGQSDSTPRGSALQAIHLFYQESHRVVSINYYKD